MHGDVPVGTEILNNSTNDSRFLRRHGIASYGVPPFLADVSLTASIHGRDERIRLDWFQAGCVLMRSVVRNWANDILPAEVGSERQKLSPAAPTIVTPARSGTRR